LWFYKGQISAWAPGARHGRVDLNLAVKRLQIHDPSSKLGLNIVLKLWGSIVGTESKLIFLQEVWNLKLKLLLPSKLLKRVLLKLLITPRGRSRKSPLTQRKRTVMMTVKMVKNRSMGRRKRKGEVGILVEVKVRVLINPPVGVVALLQQIKAHGLPMGKLVKEEGPGSHHKFHIPCSRWKFCFSS
jgi:hypothetical protein